MQLAQFLKLCFLCLILGSFLKCQLKTETADKNQFRTDSLQLSGIFLPIDAAKNPPDSTLVWLGKAREIASKRSDRDYSSLAIQVLLRESNFWSSKGDAVKALDKLKEAKSLAVQHSACEIGTILELIEKKDSTFDFQSEWNPLVPKYKSAGQIQCLIQYLSKVADKKRDKKQYKEAVAQYSMAVEYAREAHLPLETAENTRQIARCYFFEENYTESLQYFESILNTIDNLPEEQVLKARSGIASCYNALGKKTEGLEILYELKDAYERRKDYRGLVVVLNNIASSFKSQNKNKEAKAFYEEALANCEKIQEKNAENTEMTIQIFINIGIICTALEQHAEAIAALEKARDLLKNNNNLPLLSKVYAQMGTNYFQINAPEKARECFQLSQEIPIPNSKAIDATRHILYGNYLNKVNQSSEAISVCSKAYEIAEKSKLQDILRNCEECLYEAYRNQRQFEQANNHLIKWHVLRDSIANEEKLAELTRQKMTYEYNKYKLESEMALNKLEFKAQKSQSANQRNIAIALIFCILALLAALFWRYRNQRNQMLNRILSDNNQELLSKNALIEAQKMELKEKTEELNQLNLGLLDRNAALEKDLKSKLTMLADTLRMQEELTEYIDTSKGMEPHMKVQLKKIVDSRDNKELIKKIDYQFITLHENFYKNLTSAFPALTANNLKLCTYIKMNLSTKEIASLQFTTIDAVSKAKLRLRKMLNLAHSDISLTQFLNNF